MTWEVYLNFIVIIFETTGFFNFGSHMFQLRDNSNDITMAVTWYVTNTLLSNSKRAYDTKTKKRIKRECKMKFIFYVSRILVLQSL